MKTDFVKELDWLEISVTQVSVPTHIIRKAQAKAPYSASILSFLGCYNCRFDNMKNVSFFLLSSKGKERIPIMFWFCLHFGNKFFFFFFLSIL